jgi:hypothetical protein
MSELTQGQIDQLKNDPQIQATIERNKIAAAQERESKLMMLGYNQALLETGQIPEGMSRKDLEGIVANMREKLGKL